MPPDKEQAKEIARQEQFWFTGTTLGFVGFVGSLLKTSSLGILILVILLILLLSAFSIYLIVGRHKHYREQNDEKVRGWWHALLLARQEKSGTLYCITVVSFAAVGFIIIMLSRYFAVCASG